MTINLPYSTLACVVGEKIWVPPDASQYVVEQKRQEVETALNDVTRRAYQVAGADATKATPVSAMPVDAPLPNAGAKLNLYRGFTSIARPLAPMLYAQRSRRGKEDRSRSNERYGLASAERPANATIVWVHAASVGETNAVLPVIERLLAERDDIYVVLTTGTVTSAALAKNRLSGRAVHQYVPYDAAAFARQFLDHWRPALAIFTESEIWPNLILETAQADIPLALVNGRMSKKSHTRWRKNRGISLPLFSRFKAVLAQNAQMSRRFADLGCRRVVTAGNLKVDAPPQPVDAALLQSFRSELTGREIFVAASTHDGEDAEVIRAHRALRQKFPKLCTILVPRHPERGPAVAELAKSMGQRVAQRSLGQLPNETCDIYVADSIGELGLYYALTDVAFIGGSLISHGGQNPLEAVRLSTAVVTGPSQHNFADVYRTLKNSGAAIEVHSAEQLADEVSTLLSNRSACKKMMSNGQHCLNKLGGALSLTTSTLLDLLPTNVQEPSRAAE